MHFVDGIANILKGLAEGVYEGTGVPTIIRYIKKVRALPNENKNNSN